MQIQFSIFLLFSNFQIFILSDESASPAELEELMSALLAPTEECGPAIAPKVAERFEGLVKRDFNKDDLDKLKNALKPPENAKLLGTPRIQGELWNSLPQKARSIDAKLQDTQKKVSQALVGTAQAMNLITSEWKTLPKEFRSNLSVKILSSSQCLAMAMKDLNHQRRLALRPFFRKEVATVGNNIAPSLNLFGDKLEENVKAAKAAASMIRSFDNHRFQPYNGRGRTSSNLNWRGNFRGRGGGRGKGSQNNFHQNQPFHHRQFNNNKPTPPPPSHNQNNN